MGFEFLKDKINKGYLPILPSASTVLGMIGATDIGKLIMASSHTGILPVGTTADFAQAAGILGIIAKFPSGVSATTAGSTQQFYYAPIAAGEKFVATFSTSFSTALPASTDIGKYLGFSNTTTVAGAVALDMGTISNVRGTTSGCFFKITGVDVLRREVVGTINSSHIAL